jgi:hypothetical protein
MFAALTCIKTKNVPWRVSGAAENKNLFLRDQLGYNRRVSTTFAKRGREIGDDPVIKPDVRHKIPQR